MLYINNHRAVSDTFGRFKNSHTSISHLPHTRLILAYINKTQYYFIDTATHTHHNITHQSHIITFPQRMLVQKSARTSYLKFSTRTAILYFNIPWRPPTSVGASTHDKLLFTFIYLLSMAVVTFPPVDARWFDWNGLYGLLSHMGWFTNLRKGLFGGGK